MTEHHKQFHTEAEERLREIVRAQAAEIEELRIRLRDLRAEMAARESEPEPEPEPAAAVALFAGRRR